MYFSFFSKRLSIYISTWIGGFAGGSLVKNQPNSGGSVGSTPGWEDHLEKEMATNSSILVWEILRTEEPARLQSTGLQKELDTT